MLLNQFTLIYYIQFILKAASCAPPQRLILIMVSVIPDVRLFTGLEYRTISSWSVGLRANVEITTRVEDCLLCFLMFSKLFSNVLMTKLTLALTRNNHHDAKPDLSRPNDANRKDRIQNFDK